MGQYVNKPWLGNEPPREAFQASRIVKPPLGEINRWVEVITPANRQHVRSLPVYKYGYNLEFPSMTRTQKRRWLRQQALAQQGNLNQVPSRELGLQQEAQGGATQHRMVKCA